MAAENSNEHFSNLRKIQGAFRGWLSFRICTGSSNSIAIGFEPWYNEVTLIQNVIVQQLEKTDFYFPCLNAFGHLVLFDACHFFSNTSSNSFRQQLSSIQHMSSNFSV